MCKNFLWGVVMNINDIVKCVVGREGLKSSVTIGNVREIIGIVSDLVCEDVLVVETLIKNGKRRSKKKRK